MGTSPSGGIMPPAPDYLAPRRIYGPSKAKRRKQVNPTGPKIKRQDGPRRCDTNQVGAIGECLHCDAEQGEMCKSPVRRAPAADLGDRDAPNTNDPHVSMT